MVNSRMQELITQYLKAYNSFDIDGMLSVLHENITFRNISNQEVTAETNGIHEFRALAEQSAQIFSQRRQEITNITVTGDSASVDINYEGILSADLPNGLKAGATIKLQGKSIYKMKDDKLIWIEDRS